MSKSIHCLVYDQLQVQGMELEAEAQQVQVSDRDLITIRTITE